MQPPTESVQDSGQRVDKPCDDAPPPIAVLTPPRAASEPSPPSATEPPPADTPLSVPVPALVLSASPDPPQTDGPSVLLVFGDGGAEGGASQGMATSAPGQAEAPMAAVKLKSVLDPTELSTVSAERWRSRGEGEAGVAGESRDPHGLSTRLNKVSLRKPPDRMCPQDRIVLCSVVIIQSTVKKSCEWMSSALHRVLPKTNIKLVFVISANLRILHCQKVAVAEISVVTLIMFHGEYKVTAL